WFVPRGVQRLLQHVVPPTHLSPHPLQFWFVLRGVQLPLQHAEPTKGQQLFPQAAKPALHTKPHTPLLQVAVELAGAGQARLSQPPQCCGSLLKFVQTPWQSSGRRSGQTHFSPEQVLPPVHVSPQPLQFWSVPRGVQLSLQHAEAGGQQVPAQQYSL